MEIERVIKVCRICNDEFDESAVASPLGQAGEWLAAEVWQDAGELCPRCLENRGRLAMMYVIDR